MKILMVVDSIVKGGRERRMLELVKGLTQPGENYTVYLVTLTNVIEYEYVHKLPITLEVIERRSKKDPRVIFRLRKIIQTFQPDVIHSWGSMASVYLSAVRLFTRNAGFINGTISDAFQNIGWRDKVYMRIKLTTPFSKVILANSQAGIKAYRVPVDRTICIYNGIDLRRFDNLPPAEAVALDLLGRPKGDSFVGVMVGAFEHRKDYDTMVKAAVQLCSKNQRVIFILVGEGSLLTSIKSQVPPALLQKQIYFPGSRPDVESILQIADVGLLITPCEGISNSIMEYMAAGKPVIASREGGTGELVLDNETGFLIDQKRPDQIVARMEQLMNEPGLAQQMGRKGQERIHQHFDISKMTGIYKEIYKKYRRRLRAAQQEIDPDHLLKHR